MTKIAIVTGAGSGIGRGVSLALSQTGWSVTLAGRRRETLEETAAQAAGAPTLVAPTDVADPDAVEALFAATQALRPPGLVVQ